MGSSCQCVRVSFFAFNWLFWLLGLLALGIGIYSRVQTDTWKDLVNSDTIVEASNLLIIAGAIVAVLGFLGCFGALKKYRWLLAVYAFVVVCVLAMQITAGTYAYVKREKVEQKLTTGLKTGVNVNYGKPDAASKALTKAIDWFQQNVKCCGSKGPEDWKTSDWRSKTKTGEVVPRTCCRVQYTNCNVGVGMNSTSIYDDGCVEAGKKYAKDNIWLLGGIGMAVGAIEVFGVVTSLCLCKAFHDENRVRDI